MFFLVIAAIFGILGVHMWKTGGEENAYKSGDGDLQYELMDNGEK